MKHETRCGSIEEHAVRVLEEDDDVPETRVGFVARVEAEYEAEQNDGLTAAQGREWAETELRAAWGDR